MDIIDLLPLDQDECLKGMAVKVDDAGDVTAEIATLNVVDHDGDVTLPGFFGRQSTRMVWHHDRAEWIGKGVIRETGQTTLFEGRFFMDTNAGRERHAQVKAMGELAEWSYGFRVKAGGAQYGEWQGQTVRFLQPMKDAQPGADVFEVSPVLQGAGIRTRTLTIKSQEGVRFTDQLQATVEAVQAATERALAISALRSEQGKGPGQQTVELLDSLAHNLGELQGTVVSLAHTPDDDRQPSPPPADPTDSPDLNDEQREAMALALHAANELAEVEALLANTGSH